jgi:steroid 5-alpha reductase family enzyme
MGLLVSYGYLTVVSPLIMSFLLLRVSGVLLLEKTMEHRPGYKEYKETTPAFVPQLNFLLRR